MPSPFGKLFKLSEWALEPYPSTFAPNNRWSNRDMDPVAQHLRTWTTWNYVTFWISDAANVGGWELASSMLAAGLSWRQALLAIAIGHTIIAKIMVLNGTIGARLHVSFPVLSRSSFGFWFSYFSVISRIVLSMFWFSIQTYIGSECLYQMLKAIWPSTARIPNHFPLKSHITTVGMMCYFIFWLIQLPFMLVSPQRIRYLFLAKSIIVPIAWLSILIWAVIQVPISTSLNRSRTSLSGSSLGWAWLSALNSALGGFSTLAVNVPDFTRYAKNEQAQFVQFFIIPISSTIVGFIGIVVTSSGEVLYGSTLWDPLTLIDRWNNRPAAFFASFSFLLATLGVNISANSLSAANDMTVLFPRYINIKRGQVFCALVGGWVLCPWQILGSAVGFLTFMAGYSIFLGPFVGIMVVDYWMVHKGVVDLAAMYNPQGRYRYWKGINWRAAVALLCSVTPNLPGLMASINKGVQVSGMSRLFDIGWLFGFFVASFVYWFTSTLFPAKETFVDEAIFGDDDETTGRVMSKPDIREGVEIAV